MNSRDEAQSRLREIAKLLKAEMPPSYGFILMIAERGPSGKLFYASDFKREDVVRALNEFLKRATSAGDYGKEEL
jgi:hypothetical protein